MKTVAMIPVRMGSARIKKKNLRLLAGKPLVAWIIEAAIAADCFDEIYLNSEDQVFSEIAQAYGIKFYQRPPEMATDQASNDDFMYDFLSNVPCDCVIQLLATSPFLCADTIRKFTDTMDIGNYDTQVSVKNIQIECIFNKKAINFQDWTHTQPSQDMDPIKAYACGIMGWNASVFKSQYELDNGAYHGCNAGFLNYYELKGYETVDIDQEEDFALAEAIVAAMRAEKKKPEYYLSKAEQEGIAEVTETEVESILTRDGVTRNMLNNVNHLKQHIPEIIKAAGNAPWSWRLVNTPTGSATLICQNPGEGNREHYHPDISEWWYIIEGIYEFKVDGKAFYAEAGDFIFVEKGKRHLITAAKFGLVPAIRLAVSVDGAKHVYLDETK